ncbi:hypothetical protein GGR92_003672 [Spirosoma lacussanchae]|uniref:hypothetical protein n=1 Tax=Spirosoma lacussanchae TaxID=1884249 RepID=UPI0011092423|nr:hypothetical protein [Spirosoma lacussanchae]
MSNSLADFADDDVAGRRPVVEKILAIREAWKDARYELQTGQPRRPEKQAKPATASQGLLAAEIRLELQKIRVNISKNEGKLADRPEHRLATTWSQELARLRAIKEQYDDELRRMNYESTKAE